MISLKNIDKPLLLLLGGAVLIKLAFAVPVFLDPSRALACTDAFFYSRIAHNLLSGNGFSMCSQAPYNPDSTVAPGYPFFLAGIFALFGNSQIAVILIQIILDLVLLFVFYNFLKKRFGQKIALLTGIIFILDVNLSIYVNQLTSEALFTTLFIPALIMILASGEEKGFLPAVWAGLLLGAATLVRPVILYFGVSLLLFFILTRLSWRKLAKLGIIVGLQFVLLVPWVVRNRIVFNENVFSTVSQTNLVRYHAAPLKAYLEHKTREQAQQEIEEAALGDRTGLNEVGYLNSVAGEASRYILKHPVPYIGAAFVGGLGSLIYPLPLHETGVYLEGQRPPPPGSIVVDLLSDLTKGRIGEVIKRLWQERLLYYGILTAVLFIIYGLFHLAKLAFGLRAYIVSVFKDPFMILSLITGVYFLGLLGLAVVPRMRVPVEPLLLSLAGIGLFAKKGEKKDQKKAGNEK